MRSSSIKQLLTNATASIDRLDAEVLLTHVLHTSRAFLVAHADEKLNKIQEARYKWLVHKRKHNIPVAYLTGHKEFFDLDFLVNKHTLIPRPETEIMVEQVLEQLNTTAQQHESTAARQHITYVDVGTGSGCIPISLLKNVTGYRLQITGYATDISKPALKVAKENAKKHNVDLHFKHGSLLEPIQSEISNQKSAIIITANLPYITENQYEHSPTPEIHHEPKSALVAENNGLALYEELLSQIEKLITSYELRVTVFLEIDPSQTKQLTTMIKQIFPKATIAVKQDLCGRDRIVKMMIDAADPS